jgi:hypothetical protein
MTLKTPGALPIIALSLMACASTVVASPLFLISGTSFNFGDVGYGTTSPEQTVTITNVSGVAQTMSGAGGGAGVFGGAQNCEGQTLAPGASCQMFYAFTPSSYGSVSGSTNGEWNGQNFDLSFKGDGVDSFLLSPTGLNFGNVALGATSTQQTVTITNVSGVAQLMNGAGGGAGVFGGAQNCQGTTLAPGASCQMFYAFTPTSAGSVSGSTNGEWNGQNFDLSFTGTGGSSGAKPFLISGTTLNFGDVGYGTTSPEQAVTITNVSGVAQTMSGAGGGAGVFGGAQNCEGQTLAPGASCQMFYAFTPSSYGSVSGSTNGSWNGQNFDLSFEGDGVDSFLISPTALDFGDVALGTTSPEQAVDIYNVSDEAQTMSGAGGGAGVFGGAQNCEGQTLAPGAYCQMFYAFTPTSAGFVSDSTNGEWNGQNFDLSFTGYGVGPSGSTGVPEPATVLLIGPGLAALLTLRRKRRAK